MKGHTLEVNPLYYFFVADKRIAWIWFIARIYVGYQWLEAGWEKFNTPAWIGSEKGQALAGFINGALQKTSGAHPDVQSWYAAFLQTFVLPHVVTWSYFVTYGEMLVGAALILGFLVGITAFIGGFMNLNFMLAGSVSVNPIWFTISIGLMFAWRIAGYWGLDYWTLPEFRRIIRLQL